MCTFCSTAYKMADLQKIAALDRVDSGLFGRMQLGLNASSLATILHFLLFGTSQLQILMPTHFSQGAQRIWPFANRLGKVGGTSGLTFPIFILQRTVAAITFPIAVSPLPLSLSLDTILWCQSPCPSSPSTTNPWASPSSNSCPVWSISAPPFEWMFFPTEKHI